MSNSSTNSPAPPKPSLLRVFAALFYDTLILLGLFMVVGFAVVPLHQALTGQETIPAGTLYLPVLLYLVCLIYFVVSWHVGGQTIGMKAWKFTLSNSEQSHPDWHACLIRFFAAQISLLCFGLGYFSSFWHPEKLTWHDRISRTRLTLT